MTKLLFLDIDETLNNTSRPSFPNEGSSIHQPLDPQNLKALHMILDAVPDAGIVITSVWRKTIDSLEAMRWRLLCEDIPPHRVVGLTPVLASGIRGEEIASWLMLTGGLSVTSYVIIDDSSDAGCGLIDQERFIKVSPTTGLTQDDAKKAIEILLR